MIRYALSILLLLHGVAHLVGFVAPWRLITFPEQPYRTTIVQGRIDVGDWGIRLYGLGWLALAGVCAAIALGVFLRSSWWLVGLEGLVGASLVFCTLSWPEARLGVFANLLILVVAFATIRFRGNDIPIGDPTVEDLWESAPLSDRRRFDPATLSGLPSAARLFLEHAIVPDAPLASAVRLQMHGEIKLGGWRSFQAEEVILEHGGFIWAATVSAYGLPIRGADRLLMGEGSMSWRFLDIFPVVAGSGPQITRSGIGRFHGELAAWLPSALLRASVVWKEGEPGSPRATLVQNNESTEIELELGPQGGLRTVKFRRWGDPEGKEYGYFDFRVVVDEERRFGGFTIPSRIRAGWFVGSERFESDWEFFRAVIDSAEYK